MYCCKSEGVLFNLESDGLLSLLPLLRVSQGSGLVFYTKVGFLLFFLLKGFPGISKRKGVKEGWGRGGSNKNRLADVKLNGRLGLHSDLFYMIRYHVHYHYVTAIFILLLRGLFSMNML